MFHLLLAVVYLAFISLGLPDGLLGAAWPSIYPALGVPVSYAGAVSMTIAAGTIISSLLSDRLTRLLGTGKVTLVSVAMTAAALFGFSFSHSFLLLILWAVPYGLGAGSVDAALNNYVALHYASSHMSWLHCMWGIGAAAGPYIMGYALAGSQGWNAGYRYVGLIQLILTAILLASLPFWKKRPGTAEEAASSKPLTLPEILRIPGAKPVLICFLCYCGLEATASLWASSYLTLHRGIAPETAASMASLFFLGITAGRAASGFAAMKLRDAQMIRLGLMLIGAGLIILLIPGPAVLAAAGILLVGLGCAPIYPCIIHSTPARFGADKSQAMIGVQMAAAYVGSCLVPPLFGLIAGNVSVGLWPVYLLALLVLMSVSTADRGHG